MFSHRLLCALPQSSRCITRLTPRCRTVASSTTRFSTEPFYGNPRASSSNNHINPLQLVLQNAWTALQDPTRADAVAAVGELTGRRALRQLQSTMQDDATGRWILHEKPIVSKATIPYQELLDSASDCMIAKEEVTFGQAYGRFLQTHGFDPDERDNVKYLDDEELSYVMLRYRQCHDFWHALTGLPPTVPGELGLKWLELFQTGLPLAAFSSTIGSLRLSPHELDIVWRVYLPWALEHRHVPFASLMCVYYEKEWDTPLQELRDRLQIKAAPQVETNPATA